MRLVLMCGLVAGCFSKPPGPSGVGSDANADGADGSSIDAPGSDCRGVAFGGGGAANIGNFGGAFAAEPTMSSDQLELYFTSNPTPGDDLYWYDIRRATRDSPADAFTLEPEVDAFNQLSVADTDAALSDDGLTIMFVSLRLGAPRAHTATRANRGSAWTQAQPVMGLESQDVASLDLSPNGLTLYFIDGQTPSQLRVAHRPDELSSFTVAGQQLGEARLFPTLSADGMELFWNDGSGISTATRTAASMSFGNGGPAIIGAFDPDLSPDGQTLVAATGGGIGIYTRICPTAQ